MKQIVEAERIPFGWSYTMDIRGVSLHFRWHQGEMLPGRIWMFMLGPDFLRFEKRVIGWTLHNGLEGR